MKKLSILFVAMLFGSALAFAHDEHSDAAKSDAGAASAEHGTVTESSSHSDTTDHAGKTEHHKKHKKVSKKKSAQEAGQAKEKGEVQSETEHSEHMDAQ